MARLFEHYGPHRDGEPEPSPDLQERYFQLVEARVAADEAARAAHAAEEDFLLANVGIGFRVFRPEWVEALHDDTIEPLFPAGGV